MPFKRLLNKLRRKPKFSEREKSKVTDNAKRILEEKKSKSGNLLRQELIPEIIASRKKIANELSVKPFKLEEMERKLRFELQKKSNAPLTEKTMLFDNIFYKSVGELTENARVNTGIVREKLNPEIEKYRLNIKRRLIP
jgi:hypothetical protein